MRHGDNDAAQPWRDRAYARADQEDAARRERATLPFKKVYSPHGLDEAALTAMRAVFAACAEIDRAYIVRKRLDHFPELPLYVIGFQNRRFNRADKAVQAVQQRLVNEIKCSGECLIVSMTGNNAPLAKVMKKVEGAEIYRR